MASISKLFREAFINASNVSMLSHILLPLLTQFCFENSCLQMAILVGVTSTYCYNDINKGQVSPGGHKLHSVDVGWQKLEYTRSVPNYLSVLTGTQILRNLWGIFKNIPLGSNPGLNQFSIVLFCTQNGVVNGLIRLQSCFHVQF